jgi:hypothetical protein
MSDQVTFAHVLQFTTNVKHKLQQMGSKLRDTVSTGSHVGQGAVPVEQIGAVTAQLRESRHGDTPILDTPHARRWVFPSDYEWGDMVDKQDVIRALIDPKSPYTEAGVNALGRQIDDAIIAAATATSTVGTIAGGGNTTTEAFDTTNFSVAAATGLTTIALRQVWLKFAAANLDMDREQIFVVIGPEQAAELFGVTNFSSQDFVNQKPLPNASLPPFLGFNFRVSTRLAFDAGTNIRTCLAYARSGLHLGMWNDIEVKADQRADKGFNWQLYARATFGATRLEQGRVIRIQCTEDGTVT